ncbi:sigma-70 family RNA polymerase sigma factor [Myxococcota bacterium]|nr:sigma-70 family RNA polymerase sigma factor [Myxococcota bacterium]
MSQTAETPLTREQLIHQYRPYVRNIVSKIMKTLSPDVDFDDLVGYGELGLIEAADRFDPKFKVNFMTFAYYRIRGAVYDGLRGMGWISRSQYTKLRYEERANAYLASANERHASNHEQHPVQDEVNQISEVIAGLASIFITSLDAQEGLQIEDDDKDKDPLNQIETKQAQKLLREALQKLPEQERTLLEYYYYRDFTLEQAGEQLGLSKSWASRLHARAIQKLQKLVSELDPLAPEEPPASKQAPRARRF